MPERATATAAIEVTAGLIPMKPIEELTRRWFITSSQWAEAEEKNRTQTIATMPVDYVSRLLADVQGQAIAYAQLLMFQPNQYNFVRVDWIWL